VTLRGMRRGYGGASVIMTTTQQPITPPCRLPLRGTSATARFRTRRED
jgi:hypothetical protein